MHPPDKGGLPISFVSAILQNVFGRTGFDEKGKAYESGFTVASSSNSFVADYGITDRLAIHDEPIKINIDKSGANVAGVKTYNDDEGTEIEIRQNKFLNNIIEQDHRPIKQLCRATLGFQTFRTAKIIIGGFEAMRVIRKPQVKAEGSTSAEIFHSLAA